MMLGGMRRQVGVIGRIEIGDRFRSKTQNGHAAQRVGEVALRRARSRAIRG